MTPALLLVEDERLLDEEISGCPVVFASASHATPPEEPGTLQEEGESVYLVQVDDGSAPLRVAMSASRGVEISGVASSPGARRTACHSWRPFRGRWRMPSFRRQRPTCR